MDDGLSGLVDLRGIETELLTDTTGCIANKVARKYTVASPLTMPSQEELPHEYE